MLSGRKEIADQTDDCAKPYGDPDLPEYPPLKTPTRWDWTTEKMAPGQDYTGFRWRCGKTSGEGRRIFTGQTNPFLRISENGALAAD